MEAKDFSLTEDGDMKIINGDFHIINSNEQHVEHILTAVPGDYKQYPLMGINIRSALNGLLDGDLRREIKIQLESDGFTVSNVTFNGEQLIIDAERNNS